LTEIGACSFFFLAYCVVILIVLTNISFTWFDNDAMNIDGESVRNDDDYDNNGGDEDNVEYALYCLLVW